MSYSLQQFPTALRKKYKVLSMPRMIWFPPTSPTQIKTSHLHSTTVAPATVFPQLLKHAKLFSPWADLRGTLPFNLRMPSFHPSSFRLNVTPLEEPCLILHLKEM